MKKLKRLSKPNPEDLPVQFTLQAQQSQKMKPNDQRLHVEILRLYALQRNRQLLSVWSKSEQQLCKYFSNYIPLKQSKIKVNQLLSEKNLKLVKLDNKIYFGNVVNKKRSGKGISIVRNSKLYQGQFFENEKNGYGIEVYANNNLYIGQFLNNKKHGQGKFYWFNLNSANPNAKQQIQYYEGAWWGGLPDGSGVHYKINGDCYKGFFKNGLKHGQGSQQFANGDFYKGQYVNGKPQGFGQYIWGDGSSYKGNLKQGVRQGYGSWKFNKQGTEVYQGHYLNDLKQGYGVYQWQNGWIYKGNFSKDYRHGYGQLYDGAKLIYKGFWQQGQKGQRGQKEQKGQKISNQSKSFQRSSNKSKPALKDFKDISMRSYMSGEKKSSQQVTQQHHSQDVNMFQFYLDPKQKSKAFVKVDYQNMIKRPTLNYLLKRPTSQRGYPSRNNIRNFALSDKIYINTFKKNKSVSFQNGSCNHSQVNKSLSKRN